MAGVDATAQNPVLANFPDIFTLLEAGQNTTLQVRLELIINLPLGERPLLVVCLNSP